MKLLDSPWLMFIMIMGFFLFVEGLHMYEHQHCRSCPECLSEDY